jgi:hypothetical protein
MKKSPLPPISGAGAIPVDERNHFADAGKAEDGYFWGSFAAAGLEKDIKSKCSVGDYVVVNIDTKADYVVSPLMREAVELFRKQFLESRGYIWRVGEPLPLRTI